MKHLVGCELEWPCCSLSHAERLALHLKHEILAAEVCDTAFPCAWPPHEAERLCRLAELAVDDEMHGSAKDIVLVAVGGVFDLNCFHDKKRKTHPSSHVDIYFTEKSLSSGAFDLRAKTTP